MGSLVGAADFPAFRQLHIDVQAAIVASTPSSGGEEVISEPIEVFRNAHNLEELSLQGIKLSQI